MINTIRNCLISAVAVAFAGCASAPPPAEFVAPNLSGDAIDNLVLLPVVDHRIDTEKELKLDKWVHNVAEARLKKSDYVFSVETNRDTIAAVTRDGLEEADPEMIADIGPDGSRWVLLLVLHDASSKMTFGSSGGAEMTGYLMDKETNEVVWRNKEFAEFSMGGLMGMTMKGQMQRGAVELVTDKVLKVLPERTDD